MSEGALCEGSWNAAIDAAASCFTVDVNPTEALERIRRLRYTPNNDNGSEKHKKHTI
jgi:hypothetical protein